MVVGSLAIDRVVMMEIFYQMMVVALLVKLKMDGYAIHFLRKQHLNA